MATQKNKTQAKRNLKSIVVAVSGGFDPIHVGHVRMFQAASKLGDELVVILNNDHWLMKKKGHVFMPVIQRKAIIEAFRCVDRVVLTRHSPDTNDISVCEALERIRPNIFANGGDRTKTNIPEVPLCKKIGCKMVFNIGRGGKIESSSWLLKRFLEHARAYNYGSSGN